MRTLQFLTAAICLAITAPAVAAEPLRMYGEPARREFSPYAHLNLTPDQLLAAHELELAQHRFVIWTHFEFPTRLREIEAELIIVREQLASWQRRYAEFSRFAVWSGGGDAFFETREDLHLGIVATRERLALLENERASILQQQPLEYRQRQLEVERARLQLRLAR